MKYGICLNFTKTDNKIEIKHLDFIKSCGFDYLELALNSVAALTDPEFYSLLKYLVSIEMPVLVCNCFMDGKIAMTGEISEKEIKSYVEKAVARAAQMGVEKLVLGSGGSRNVPSGFPMDKAKKQFDWCVDFIISEVSKHGIVLELEHLNRLESNIITSFSESTEMVQAKKSENFKSILDYFHFAVGNENLDLITERAAEIGHIHFARPLGRVYPNLPDMDDLSEILMKIKSSGYSDTFSMECAFPEMAKEPASYGEVLQRFKQYFK